MLASPRLVPVGLLIEVGQCRVEIWVGYGGIEIWDIFGRLVMVCRHRVRPEAVGILKLYIAEHRCGIGGWPESHRSSGITVSRRRGRSVRRRRGRSDRRQRRRSVRRQRRRTVRYQPVRKGRSRGANAAEDHADDHRHTTCGSPGRADHHLPRRRVGGDHRTSEFGDPGWVNYAEYSLPQRR